MSYADHDPRSSETIWEARGSRRAVIEGMISKSNSRPTGSHPHIRVFRFASLCPRSCWNQASPLFQLLRHFIPQPQASRFKRSAIFRKAKHWQATKRTGISTRNAGVKHPFVLKVSQSTKELFGFADVRRWRPTRKGLASVGWPGLDWSGLE